MNDTMEMASITWVAERSGLESSFFDPRGPSFCQYSREREKSKLIAASAWTVDYGHQNEKKNMPRCQWADFGYFSDKKPVSNPSTTLVGPRDHFEGTV